MQEKKKSSVGIIIAILVVSLLIAGGVVASALIISSSNTNSKESTKTSEEVEPTKKREGDNPGILSTDHVRGKRDSKVLVVEYADPQCPGCAQMMPKMDAIYEDYKDRVAFVYRHYPITGHQNAVTAAVAIEAAGKQGYFWEMLTAMFANRADWVANGGNSLTNAYVEIFEDVTNGKGDTDKFKDDLDNESLKKKVELDKELGRKDEISATPTIFVNGKEVDFYSSSNAKQSIIDAINKASED